MNGKTVLITGGTGFVGANLVERLVKDGHRVHLFVRAEYRDWRIAELLPHLQIHLIDLLDAERLRAKVAEIHPEWIFHLATYGAYSWQDDPNQAIGTNFLGTINLLEACRSAGFEVFVNTGSSSEYGAKDHAPAEDDFLEPNSYYAVTKASSTLFCRYTAQRYNLPIHTLRLYSVFGPYEEPNRLIPNLIVKGLQGELPPLARPDTARDFIFVEDVNRAYLFMASSSGHLPPGDVYNVGTARQTTLREVVETARKNLSIELQPAWGNMENRSWDTNIWVANNQKLKMAGWTPIFDFNAGFLKTIEWFRQNPALIEKIYLTRG